MILTTEFSPSIPRPKAPAVDCVEEAKAAAKRDSCPTLKRIASARVESVDEPLFKALSSCELTLDFPIEELKLDDDGFMYPCFPPRGQLEVLAAKGYFHRVLGLPVAYSEYVLPNFWINYQGLVS